MTELGPNVLLIGAARSGTTMLASVLSRHPDIFFCDPKEPHFLAFAGTRVAFSGPGDDEWINRRAVTDEARWRRLFTPGSHQRVRGDGSVTTLYHHDTSIPNIERHCPDVAMIVILREPAARAFSAWAYLTGRGVETESFERGLDLEDERVALGYQHLWHYTRGSDYATLLRPFVERFGLDRLLVVEHEALLANPAVELGRIFAFLGIHQAGITELGNPVNPGGESRIRSIPVAINWIQRHQRIRGIFRAAIPYGLRESVRGRTLRDVAMPSELAPRLDGRFAPGLRDLAEMLGPAVPRWAGEL